MGKGWPPPLPLVHTFLPPEKSFGASFLPSFAHDPGKQGTVGMQVRAALRQQMPATPHQPFSFHGRPPAAKEPLCGGDTQAPPRNKENGTLGLPLLGPQGLSQGAGAPGLKILKSLQWLLSVCPVTHSLPLQLNTCSSTPAHSQQGTQETPGKALQWVKDSLLVWSCVWGVQISPKDSVSLSERS